METFNQIKSLFLSLLLIIFSTGFTHAQFVISESSISDVKEVTEFRFGVDSVHLNVVPMITSRFSYKDGSYTTTKKNLKLYTHKYDISEFIPDEIFANFYKVSHLNDVVFLEIKSQKPNQKKHLLLALLIGDNGEGKKTVKIVVPRGNNYQKLLNINPAEFVKFPRQEWLITRLIAHEDRRFTIDNNQAYITYFTENRFLAKLEEDARDKIAEKVGRIIADKHIKKACDPAQLGFSFQSAGRDLYNRGKLIDVYYYKGECIVNGLIGLTKTRFYIGYNPRKFECTDKQCVFPMHLLCGTNGNPHALCGDAAFSRNWTVTASRNKNGEYELVKIEDR